MVLLAAFGQFYCENQGQKSGQNNLKNMHSGQKMSIFRAEDKQNVGIKEIVTIKEIQYFALGK